MRNPLQDLAFLNALNLHRPGREKLAYEEKDNSSKIIKQRTFRENIQDQLTYHRSRIADLESLLDSMTPDVEKFVEAVQKLS